MKELGGNVIDLGVLHHEACGIIDSDCPSVVSKQVCPYVTLSAGALLINQQGSRFCNELGLSHTIVDRYILFVMQQFASDIRAVGICFNCISSICI